MPNYSIWRKPLALVNELKGTLQDLSHKLKKKTFRNSALSEMGKLITLPENSTDLNIPLEGLYTLTGLLFYNKFSDEPVISEISTTISKLKENHSDITSKYVQYSVEPHIGEWDDIIGRRVDLYSAFIKPFQKVVVNCLENYIGNKIRISHKIGNYDRSIAITAKQPEIAIAFLDRDKPRILFSEYSEFESAETFVSNMYGSDGAYYKHFADFLNCRGLYPNQAHKLKLDLK